MGSNQSLQDSTETRVSGDDDALQPKETAADGGQVYTTISALPVDLLALIFSYFDVHPRLLVISIVCKFWHRAALRSITSFESPLWNNERLGAWRVHTDYFPRGKFISRLTALRELTLRAGFGNVEIALPLSLTRLVIGRDEDLLPNYEFIDHIPALSSLKLSSYDRAGSLNADRIVPVISAGLTSITSLSLPCHLRLTLDSQRVFTKAHLVALVDLSFKDKYAGPLISPLGIDFMHRHASQLTRLDLCTGRRPPDSIVCPLPNVLSLRLDGLRAEQVIQFLANAPKLRGLGLDWNTPLERLPSSSLSLITQLELYGVRDMETLSKCSGLRRVHQSVTGASTEHFKLLAPLFALPLGIGPSIRKLVLWRGDEATLQLIFQNCTNLMSLSIFNSSNSTEDITAVVPQLKKLRVYRHEWVTLTAIFDLATKIVAVAPRLESVWLQKVELAAKPDDIRRQLSEFLLNLTARSLRCVMLSLNGGARPSDVRDVTNKVAQAGKGWLRLVVLTDQEAVALF